MTPHSELCWDSDIEIAVLSLKRSTVIDREYWFATVAHIENGIDPETNQKITISGLEAWGARCKAHPAIREAHIPPSERHMTMLTIRPAACRLRVDMFPTRKRSETTALNISYTNTIADDRIDAAAMDYFDARKSYLGCTFHYVILLDGSVEIGRNPKTLSSRGRSARRRRDTVFIGVVGGLNYEDGRRKDTITDAQREAVADLEQAIADTLSIPLDVIDFTVEWTGSANVEADNEIKEIELEDQLDRTEQAASLLF